jgi:vancomycin resistance protein YoaR
MYQAGLPIAERQEHSHCVEYDDPVGFEATVYAPQKNLRMTNDTGADLLVQASWDSRAQTLTFDLFGTRPPRTVSIGKPSLSHFKGPAAPSDSPEPRVRPGGQRLLDVPVQGMASLIVRTIRCADGQLCRDTLKCVYKPWGAVYGVNPVDRRLR